MIYSETTQCEAVSKRTGIRCQRRAVTGKRMCRIHGGLELPRFLGVFRQPKVFNLKLSICLDTNATDEEVKTSMKKIFERDREEKSRTRE